MRASALRALGVAVMGAGVTALATGLLPIAVTLIVVGALVGGVGWAWERLAPAPRIEEHRLIVHSLGRRRAALAWADIDSVHADRDELVIRSARETFRIRTLAWPDAYASLETIRARVRPSAWRVSVREAAVLAGDMSAGSVRRLGTRAAPIERALGYRDAATDRRPVPIEKVVAEPGTITALPSALAWTLGAALTTAATIASAAAVLAGVPFAGWFLLAGFGGVVATLPGFVDSIRARRTEHAERVARAAAFLGDEVLVSGSMWTSLDGSQRRRHHAADLLDPWLGSHEHYEFVDPDTGLTMCSYTFSSASTFVGHLRPKTREIAVLPTAIDSGRHYDGFPPELSRWAPREAITGGAARVLMIDRYADAVLVHRFSEDRRRVGDTLHDDRERAIAQIAMEYGEAALVWREIAIDDAPWSFWPTLASQESAQSQRQQNEL